MRTISPFDVEYELHKAEEVRADITKKFHSGGENSRLKYYDAKKAAEAEVQRLKKLIH